MISIPHGNRLSAVEAATAEAGASSPDETAGHRTDRPEKASAPTNWQSLLIIVLAIGLGITFAQIAPAQRIGVDNAWSAGVLDITAAGLVAGIVVALVRGIFKLFGRSK